MRKHARHVRQARRREISDFGFRIPDFNPRSAIRNPQSRVPRPFSLLFSRVTRHASRSSPFAFCLLPFAFCLLFSLPSSSAEWKLPRDYRRALTGGGNADTAIFSFCDGGHLAAGGASIVVADEHDNVLPFRTLWTRRGGDTWVAYDASKAKGSVFVYYGGTGGRIASRAANWQPKLSLLLYTMPLPRGALESHRPIQSAVMRSDIYGCDFVDKIWHGFDPFGPDDNYASYYVGYLNIGKPGKYKIFTASDEASFVFLDGKALCSWPGRHDPYGGTQGQHGGEVQLNKGEYKIEYYHAEVDGEQCMMLGWTPPGVEGWHLIPDGAYVHTPKARAGWPERRGGAPLAAFGWEPDDQLLHDKWQFTRVSFAAQCRDVPPKAKLAWDFGDGSRAEGRDKQHVYVGDGPFTVILRTVGEDGKVLDQYGVALQLQAALKNFTILDKAAVHTYVEVISATDCSKLSATMMDALWELVETEESIETVKPFVETYVARFGVKDAAWPAADRLALAISVKEPERAIRLYAALAASAPTKLDAARCQTERIEIVLHKLKDPDKALEMAKTIRATRTGFEDRIAAVKIGDVYRYQGKFAEAEEAYREAQRVTYANMDRRIIAVRQGGYLESADAHITNGDFRAAREALVMWEIEHPIGKLSGDLPLETAKYFDKLGEPDRALAELETLVKINPISPYLPEIELLMGRAYKKLGNFAKARQLFEKVMTEYPKSRAAQQARTE